MKLKVIIIYVLAAMLMVGCASSLSKNDDDKGFKTADNAGSNNIDISDENAYEIWETPHKNFSFCGGGGSDCFYGLIDNNKNLYIIRRSFEKGLEAPVLLCSNVIYIDLLEGYFVTEDDRVYSIDYDNLQYSELEGFDSLYHNSYGFCSKVTGNVYGDYKKVIVSDVIKYETTIYSEFYCSLALTEQGELYSFGENEVGQRGIGNREENYEYTKVMDNIKDCAVGNGTAFAVTKDNELYAWGFNGYGMLGRKGTKFIKATYIESKNKYEFEECNENDDCNENEQIIDYSDVPVKVMDNISCVKVNIGYVAALTTEGDLYVWGHDMTDYVADGAVYSENYYSAVLGVRPNTDANTAKDYTNFSTILFTPNLVAHNIKDFTLSNFMITATDTNDDLYVWGVVKSDFPLCKEDCYYEPELAMNNVKKVFNTSYMYSNFGNGEQTSCIIITTDGAVYFWKESDEMIKIMDNFELLDS